MHDHDRSLKTLPKRSVKYIVYFFKWMSISIAVGLVGGAVGVPFHILVEKAGEIRQENLWLIWLLPIAGVAIFFMYKAAKMPLDTNRVINAVHLNEDIPLRMAPLIFVSTIITHLFGGSAGREGAALQIGGTVGYNLGKLFKLNDMDMRLIVCCGMAAVFSALFGLPVAAAIFALEVASVGTIYYAGLIPCLCAALIAKQMALFAGIEPVTFSLAAIPSVSFASIGMTMLVSIICAVMSIFFCIALHGSEDLGKKFIKIPWLRPVFGGLMVALLTVILGTTDYNGAGMNVIAEAMAGNASPWAFFLKMLFTVLTISFGFKGGEIVPSMFVGATLGCALGIACGFNPGFCAAVGLLAMLCGMLNCPFAIIAMGVEMFGAGGIIFYAIASALGYTMSGTYGLYKEQHLVYSKLRAMYIDIKTRG